MTPSKKKFIFLCIFFAAAIITGTIQSILLSTAYKTETTNSGLAKLTSGPGVITLNIATGIFYGGSSGILGGGTTGVSQWIRTIDKARKDDRVKGMLIRMNSPGGTIGASQELYESIVRFQESGKKIVVSIIDICASGGYYISVPADTIIANPGSIIGSIGVRLTSADYSKLMDDIGVRIFNYKSVPHKDILSPFRKATEDEQAHIQSLVDDMHKEFVSVILRWRGMRGNKKTLEEASNGYIYTSAKAIELGLIDKIGDHEAAKKELARLTGLDYENLRFISYRSNFSDFRDVLGIDSLIDSIFAKIKSEKTQLLLQ